MALGRRVIRTVRLVLRSDSALDPATDYDAYVESDWQWDKLRFVGGVQPTVFILQPLTYRQKLAIQGQQQLWDQVSMAVRCALIGLENYLVERPDGSVAALPPPAREADTALGEAIKWSWLEDANLLSEHSAAIYAVVMAISEAKLPLAKPSGTPSGGGDGSEASAPAAPSAS